MRYSFDIERNAAKCQMGSGVKFQDILILTFQYAELKKESEADRNNHFFSSLMNILRYLYLLGMMQNKLVKINKFF